MTEEEKRDTSEEFGKVIDALHNKAKLSSLRTYQGDMAEFIKSKNESVISIAVKEKERKEEKEQEKQKDENLGLPKESAPKSKRGFQINITIIVLSLLLVVGGIYGFSFVFEALNKAPMNPVMIEEKIIPYNHLITLANVTSENFGPELAKISPSSGISVLKISGTDGLLFQTFKDFLNFLKISPPTTLGRTLEDEYVIGITSQDGESSYFMVITVDDFGKAFSAMLDWEKNLVKDLSFLNIKTNISLSTTTSATIQTKPESFGWKDIIVKNKDTRAFATEKNKTKIVYTFLDKNTILITNNLSTIGDISAAYASRSVVR